MPKQCGWCLRIRKPDRTWEAGPAIKLTGYSHGLCIDCLKKQHKKYIEDECRKLTDRVDAEGLSREEFQEVIELFRRLSII